MSTFAGATALLGIILTVMGLRLVFKEPALLGIGLTSLLPFWLYRRDARAREGVTVDASGDALIVGERRFPSARIVGAWARDVHTAVVVMNDRTCIVIELDPRTANELLEAIQWSVTRRTISTPLRGTLGPFTLGFCIFVATSIASIVFVDAVRELRPHIGWLILASFVFAAGVAKLFASPHMVIGADGLRIVRGPWRTFVRFAEIADVRRNERGSALVLTLTSGRTLALPMVAQEEESIVAVEERIAEGRGRAPRTVALTNLLARGERTLDQWRVDVTSLATRPAGFRDLAVTPEALSSELEDAATRPEVRVAAALALAAMEPGAPALGTAIATCADPALRGVLEAVRDGTLEEGDLDKLERG